MSILYIYCLVIFLMSLISFVLFVIDKKRAIKGLERIKEKNLMFFTVCGGSLGSELGRLVAHHKTEKGYFSIVIKFSILLQIITLVVLIIFKLFLGI